MTPYSCFWRVVFLILAVAFLALGFTGVSLAWAASTCDNLLPVSVGALCGTLAGMGIYLLYRAVFSNDFIGAYSPIELLWTMLIGVENGFVTYWNSTSGASECGSDIYNFSWILVPIWVVVFVVFFYIVIIGFCVPQVKAGLNRDKSLA